MAFIDFVFIPIIILLGHYIINTVVIRNNLLKEKSFLIKLFYYHLFFSLLFAWYVTIFGGDSVGYWKPPGRFMRPGQTWIDMHITGTPFVYFITYPFSQIIGLSFWGGTFLFSLIGFSGFICLYLTLKRTLKINPTLWGYRLFPFVLFLPNMHFWSGGVGKDTVIFFALCLFVYALTDIKNNIPGLIMGFYLSFFIRPHIAFVMLIGFAVALVMSSKGVSMFWRLSFLAISVGVFFLISATVFDFIGLEEENIENYEDIANMRSKNLSRRTVGSAIDITDYPVPLKIFTFFYRPLFFDVSNGFGLFISFENLFYILLTLSVFRFKSIIELYKMPVYLKACFFVCISTAFFMSSSLSNLGIIIRQKNMVMFMLLLVLLYLLSKIQSEKLFVKRKIYPVKPFARVKPV